MLESEPLANIEAEQAVLGVLLLSNVTFLHCAQLKIAHFHEPVHRDIFAAMLEQWGKGKHFSPVTMRAQFDDHQALADIGGGAYLGKLAGAAVTVMNVVDYVDLLVELSQRRALTAVCSEASRAAYSLDKRSPVEMAADFSVKLQEAVNDFDGSVFQDDYEVTESILSELRRDEQPIPTGYEMLDTAMDGGLYPGKSYGFAARKKMGKTILAGSISHNLNQRGIRHLFICGEMSPAEIQKRTLARMLHVEQRQFRGKEARSAGFMQRIVDKAIQSKRAVIYKNAPGLTFEDLKRYVLLARMQKKITGFILDYWQLVGGKGKGKSTAEHLDEVAQWIADTCRKYDLWSITMAQINQEGNTRGGEGIRLAFDQVYTLQAPNNDAGRTERWLDMADTRYTAWRCVGSETRPGFYLNAHGPYFSETPEGEEAFAL